MKKKLQKKPFVELFFYEQGYNDPEGEKQLIYQDEDQDGNMSSQCFLLGQ